MKGIIKSWVDSYMVSSFCVLRENENALGATLAFQGGAQELPRPSTFFPVCPLVAQSPELGGLWADPRRRVFFFFSCLYIALCLNMLYR